MDPLAILKDFCKSGQLDHVILDGERVKFADKYSFPKQTPTAFRAKDGTGDFYSLEAVSFFIKTIIADANMGNYVLKAVSTKAEQIEVRDRQPLRDYLMGKVDHTVHVSDVVPTVSFYEPAAKKPRMDGGEEAAALQHLFEQEKQLRNRNSLLCAPGANFKPVLELLDKVLIARKQIEAAQAAAAGKLGTAAAGGKPGQQQQRGTAATAAAAKGQKPDGQQQQKMMYMKPSGRMERQNVAGDLKAMGGDAAVAASLGYGYGIQVDAQQQQQQQQQARAAAAAGVKAGGSHHHHQQQQQHKGSSSSDARAAAAAAAKHKASSGSGGAAKPRGDPPIILVPSGMTAMINVFNARQFFEEGRFITTEEAMAGNPTRPSKAIEFSRTALRSASTRYPRYYITDKVPRQGSSDWKRIVAVVVQGKAWQFKGFPFKGADKGEMMETFSQLFGAFFYYSDEQVPDNVKSWKVAKLPLRRNARHLDNTVMLDFYKQLDVFLASKKCELDF